MPPAPLLPDATALFSSKPERGRRPGRKIGSRAVLAKRFFEDVHAVWEEQGEAAIRRAAFHDPMGFVAMVARLMPQKIEVSTPTDGMTDERLADMLELAERMAALKADGVRVVEGSTVSVAGVLTHENDIGIAITDEGGGGRDGATPPLPENIAHTIAAPDGEPERPSSEEHNRLSPAMPSSFSGTPALLPYPVGRPIPEADATVERRNLSRLAEPDPVDPESLF